MLPMKLEGYAIYNPTTGLWSKGGTGPVPWKKRPKIWGQISHLKAHLSQFVHVYYPSQYRPEQGFGMDVNHFEISRAYDGCIAVDVTTGISLGDNWINEYYFDFIRREKARRKYYADAPAKFRGDDEWLTNC